MNLIQLVAKQMRQRALSTWLTLFSVILGVALGITLLVFQREAGKLFGQAEFGYDLVVGAKGSKLQLVLNAVYNLDQPPGTVTWDVVESLSDPQRYGRFVRWAVPVASTDSYQGFPVVATLPSFLGVEDDGVTPLPEGERFQYRVGRLPQLAAGRAFHGRKFEAVLGSATAARTGLKLNDLFAVTHGRDAEKGHEHVEQWTVVGILAPTRTGLDGVVLMPLASSIALGEHTEGLKDRAKLIAEGVRPEDLEERWPDVIARGGERREGYVHEPATGLIYPTLPKRLWRVSAVFVDSHSGFAGSNLMFQIDNRPDAMAASPAGEMRIFFERFLEGPTQLLLMVTVLVTIVAAVSILVSIYNSVAARRREIAILRSLGATRARVLALICLEAGLIGLFGAVLGWIAGHALAAGASAVLRQRIGEGINWSAVGQWEIVYLAGVVLLAVLAGLVPALKAYATPVAQNLSE